MTRAAVYVRVSSARQAEEGLSLGVQEAKAREYIAKQGWSVLDRHVFREEGVSGARRDRQALGALMDAVTTGEVDSVVTQRVDRIGRNARHTLELRDTFSAAGVHCWDYDGRCLTADDPASKLTLGMLALAAEFERDMVKERVAGMTTAKAERGSYHGGIPPFGYIKGEHGGLVVHEPHAKWVRYMFRRFAREGPTLYEIAQELEDACAPTKRGGKWRSNRVADHIDSPIYAGRVKFDHAGKHEALIDAETFRLAQERREATKALDSNGRGRQPSIHLLSHGKLKCACGASMAPRRDSGSGRRTYRCVTRVRRPQRGSTPCEMPALPQELVDETVLRYLADQVMSPGLTADGVEHDRESAVRDARKARSDAEQAERVARDRVAQAELRMLDGVLSPERFGQLRTQFESDARLARDEAARAKATIDALQNPDADTLATVERLSADLSTVAAEPTALTECRGVVTKVFDHFEIVQADEHAPAEIADAPDIPTFIHRRPAVRGGGARTHRYYLLPNLRPDLAALYGENAAITYGLVPVPEGLLPSARPIERNGLPCLYASGPL